MITYRDEVFSQQYIQEILPSLFVKQASNIAKHQGSWMTVQSDPVLINTIIEAAQRTLLIATSKLADNLIETLQGVADKGIRVYLVLGEDDQNRRAIEALMGRCLIRTGVTQQGSLILVDHQANIERGAILSSQLHNSHTLLNLSKSQIQDYYRLFCHLFWHVAQNEYIHTMKADQKAKDSPEGLVELNHQDILPHKIPHLVGDLWDQTGIANLSQPKQFYTWANEQKGKKILISTAHIQGDLIDKLGQISSTLTLTEAAHLPTLIFGVESKAVLMPQSAEKDDVNWCVSLSPEQHAEAKQALDNWHANAEWQMKTNPRISEVQGKFRLLTQADQTLECLDSRTINVPEIHTTNMDEFFNIPTRELAKNHCNINLTLLAHQINYQVRIHPPYLPENAVPDPLYQNWRNAKESWQQQIQQQQSKLAHLEKAQASINDTVRKIISGLLFSQKESHSGLSKRLAALSLWTPEQQSGDIRDTRLKELQDIASATHKLTDELAMEVSRVEAHELWLKDKLDTEQTIEALEIKELELQGQYDQLKANQIENQLDFWQKLHGQIKGSMDKKAEGSREHPKHIIESLNGLKDENELKNWLKASEIPKSIKAETQAKLSQRYESFQKKAQREEKELAEPLRKIKSELVNLRNFLQKIGQSYIHHPKPIGANDTINTLSPPKGINWPSEELPASQFKLHKEKMQRWLVMTVQAEFSQAQLEAIRFDAKLCARRAAQ